jgi:hypothetical protein
VSISLSLSLAEGLPRGPSTERSKRCRGPGVPAFVLISQPASILGQGHCDDSQGHLGTVARALVAVLPAGRKVPILGTLGHSCGKLFPWTGSVLMCQAPETTGTWFKLTRPQPFCPVVMEQLEARPLPGMANPLRKTGL